MSPLLPVEPAEPTPCAPTVVPYGDLVDGYVMRCTCGIDDTTWPTREQAEAHRDRHEREQP